MLTGLLIIAICLSVPVLTGLLCMLSDRHERRIQEARDSRATYCRVAVPNNVTLWDDCRSQCEGASVSREH